MIIVNFHNVLRQEPNFFQRETRKEWDTQHAFERQIARLAKKFDFVPLRAIVEAVKHGRQLQRSCAITFDDGNLGSYRYGWPVLQQFGATATYFVITGSVADNGNGKLLYFDRLAALLHLTAAKRIDLSAFEFDHIPIESDQEKIAFYKAFRKRIKVTPRSVKQQIDAAIENQLAVPAEKIRAHQMHENYQMISWNQIRELQSRGGEIGGHTRTHPSLSQIDEQQLNSEIEGSYRDLIENLGTHEFPFAYPFGRSKHISPPAVEYARNSGYSCAVTMKNGVNTTSTDLFKLRRFSFAAAEKAFGI